MSDAYEAHRLIAQRRADAAAGPCAHCGGPLLADLIDVSSFNGPAWVPGSGASCVAECWRIDPEAFLVSLAKGQERRQGPA